MSNSCFIMNKGFENPLFSSGSRTVNRQDSRIYAQTHCICFEDSQGVYVRKAWSMATDMFSNPCKSSFSCLRK